MKRILAWLFIPIFLFGNIAFAADITSRIDFAAMQWYAQAADAMFKKDSNPFTIFAEENEGTILCQ